MLVPATPPPPDCPRCTKAETYIFALEADIEYLRSVALHNKFVCSRCENDDKSISSNSRKSHPKVKPVYGYFNYGQGNQHLLPVAQNTL
eukprot:2110988-Ditylum_brightwellii.AAC.1